MNSISPNVANVRQKRKQKRKDHRYAGYMSKDQKEELLNNFKPPDNKWSEDVKYAVERLIQNGDLNPADGWRPYTLIKTGKFRDVDIYYRKFSESKFYGYGCRLHTEQPFDTVVKLMYHMQCDAKENKAFHDKYPHGDAVIEIRAETVDQTTFEYYGLTDFYGVSRGILWNRDANTLVYMSHIAPGVYIESHSPINTVPCDRTRNVRMINYHGGYILRHAPGGGTHIDYYNLIDPKGYLPSFLLNVGAQYMIELAVDFVDYCDKTLGGRIAYEVKATSSSSRKSAGRQQKFKMPSKEELQKINDKLEAERTSAGLIGGNSDE